jgi:hypothetical protein
MRSSLSLWVFVKDESVVKKHIERFSSTKDLNASVQPNQDLEVTASSGSLRPAASGGSPQQVQLLIGICFLELVAR